MADNAKDIDVVLFTDKNSGNIVRVRIGETEFAVAGANLFTQAGQVAVSMTITGIHVRGETVTAEPTA